MRANFYMFPKRINSTLIPTGSGTRYDVTLKDDTSVLQPDIVLKWTGSGSPTSFNYVYIPDFMRYYWISNWTYSERCWVASCSVDVLASYKTFIGAAEKYVLRSASDYDPDVMDTLYPATAEESDAIDSKYMFVPANPVNSGSFILNVSGAAPNTTALGGCGYYVCSGAEINTIVNNAFNTVQSMLTNSPAQGTDWLENILLWIGNTFIKGTEEISRFINSITWVPIPASALAGGQVHVFLGMVDCGTASQLANPIYGPGPIEFIPSSLGISGDPWEYAEPYSHFTLESVPFGVIPLDSLTVLRQNRILADFTMDAVSGLANLKVTAGQGTNTSLLAYRTAQLGVPVEIGGYHVDYVNALSDVLTAGVTTAAGLSTGLPVLGSALAGLGNAIHNMLPDPVSGGRSGGAASADGTLTLHMKHLGHVPLDIVELGRPLCQVRQLGTLSGYILCRDGELQISCTDGELEQLEQYLTGGFFYE